MSKRKPIRVTRSSMPSYEEYCEEIRDLWESRWLTNSGEKHNELERQIADYLGVAHADLFVNGHNALECALEAFGLGEDGRNEVITTPFTFISTTNALVRKGLKPVFCDVRPSDCTLDPEKIEPLITAKTCAIVPVHVYGNVCAVDEIAALAQKHDLKVIYDAAHAFGVRKDGVGIANFGDASMFSMHATKVFHSIEGGAVAHNSDGLSDRFRCWRNYGITSTETADYVGGNLKMNEFAAAMGLCNLRHLEGEIAKRKAASERYWDALEQLPGVRVFRPRLGIQSNYAYLPVLFDAAAFGASRDGVCDFLAGHDVYARKYFYPLTSDYSCLKKFADRSSTPVAKQMAQQVLTLPLYADLAEEDVDFICSLVAAARMPASRGERARQGRTE